MAAQRREFSTGQDPSTTAIAPVEALRRQTSGVANLTYGKR